MATETKDVKLDIDASAKKTTPLLPADDDDDEAGPTAGEQVGAAVKASGIFLVQLPLLTLLLTLDLVVRFFWRALVVVCGGGGQLHASHGDVNVFFRRWENQRTWLNGTSQ
jgi:hypothetical protein